MRLLFEHLGLRQADALDVALGKGCSGMSQAGLCSVTMHLRSGLAPRQRGAVRATSEPFKREYFPSFIFLLSDVSFLYNYSTHYSNNF